MITPAVVGLVALATGSALLHLLAHYRGPHCLVYAAKPATIVFLAAVAAVAPSAAPPYQGAVIAGLLLSLLGDVFLMLPRDWFLAGLASFLAAHTAYIVAFRSDAPMATRPLLLVPYAIGAVVILAVLWPRLGRRRIPVLVYVAALVLMAWQAAARASILGGTPAMLAAVGAALFVVSDGTLAFRRFRNDFPSAQAIVMTTYVAAQVLIALSVSGSR